MKPLLCGRRTRVVGPGAIAYRSATASRSPAVATGHETGISFGFASTPLGITRWSTPFW